MNLIVFSRTGYDRKGKKSIVAKYLKNKITFINNKPVTISSSKLRKKAQKKIMRIAKIKDSIEKILDNNKAKCITSINLKINLISLIT